MTTTPSNTASATLSSSPALSSSVRLRPDVGDLADLLGPLRDLPGTWIGNGFNLIWRPNFAQVNGQPSDHFLELNLTQEVTRFDFIGAPIPNRGLAQDDILMYGVHYLQQVSDTVTRGALHIEPGIWLNIPPTTQPNAPLPNAVARLSTVPHGNALVAQGQAVMLGSPASSPIFSPVNVNPFPIPGGPPFDFSSDLTLSIHSNFRTPAPPADAMSPADFQAIVLNPNKLLADTVVGQTIVNTTVINVATSPSILVPNAASVTTPNAEGGVENIAFLKSLDGTPTTPPKSLPNAEVANMFATFWLEEVQNPFGPGTFFQLQYSQTVHLNFAGLTWPHVSVATLVRSSVV